MLRELTDVVTHAPPSTAAHTADWTIDQDYASYTGGRYHTEKRHG